MLIFPMQRVMSSGGPTFQAYMDSLSGHFASYRLDEVASNTVAADSSGSGRNGGISTAATSYAQAGHDASTGTSIFLNSSTRRIYYTWAVGEDASRAAWSHVGLYRTPITAWTAGRRLFGAASFRLQVVDATQFTCQVKIGASNNNWTFTHGLSLNTVYLLGLSWDGTTARFWVNGVVQASYTPVTGGNLDINNGGNQYGIAGDWSTTASEVVRADEVHLFTRALTQLEMTAAQAARA